MPREAQYAKRVAKGDKAVLIWFDQSDLDLVKREAERRAQSVTQYVTAQALEGVKKKNLPNPV